ncbi:MAG: acyltransferase [archaeon]|nr:acyltransferase [archaeon]
MTQVDSSVIKLIRFPLAVMVVCIHSFMAIENWNPIENMAYQSMGLCFFWYIEVALSHVLSHVAVPIFFLISGFLFFQNLEKWNVDVWMKKCINRVRTLILPYVIWNLAYWGLTGFSNPSLSLLWCSQEWNVGRVDLWGHSALASGPVLVPMWFMRNLIVCILLTPLFYKLFGKKKSLLSKISLLIISLLYFTQTSLIIPGFSSSSFFYFCLGTFVALQIGSFDFFKPIFEKSCFVLFVIFFIFLVFLNGHNTSWGNILYPLYVFLGVFFGLNLFVKFAKSPTNDNLKTKLIKLSESTFFVFAFHTFLLRYADRVINQISLRLWKEPLDFSQTFVANHAFFFLSVYLSKIFFVVTICVVLYFVLKKYMPGLSRIICGR